MQEQHDVLGWLRRTEEMLSEIQIPENDHAHTVEVAHRIGEIVRNIGVDVQELLNQFSMAETFAFHMVDDERVSQVRVPYFGKAIPELAAKEPLEIATLKSEVIEFSQAVRRLLMTLNDEKISKLHGVQDFIHAPTTIAFPEPAGSH